MFWSDLKYAIRHLKQYKIYSLLNIVGLAIGMACAILIVLWVDHEMNINKFHVHGKDIFIIRQYGKASNGLNMSSTSTPGPLAPALMNEVPEIKLAVRAKWPRLQVVSSTSKSFYENGWYVDSTFFKMFTYELFMGDVNDVLRYPNSIVISEKLSKKYFGNMNPLGKTLKVQYFQKEDIFTITGVFKDVKNSSFTFDYLIPFEKFAQYRKGDIEWDNFFLDTYILTKPNTNMALLDKKIEKIVKTNNPYVKINFFTQPYENIYLYNDFEGSMTNPSGLITLVKIFSFIAFFIIMLACMNYTNLATALAVKRTKEVGLKKVFGASRKMLVMQFALEAMIITSFAFFLSLIIVECILPGFNRIIHMELVLNYNHYKTFIIILLVPAVTGLIAGTFPSLYMSLFKPETILKNLNKSVSGALSVRHMLVIFQFMVTIAFIISSIIILKQIKYLSNKDLGLDKENMVVFEQSRLITQQRQAFKQELKKQQGIINVCFSGDNPLDVSSNTTFWTSKNPDNYVNIPYFSVDLDLIETLGIDIIEGRNFTPADSINILINQTAAKKLNLINPVGEVVEFWDRKHIIIGLVKDFNSESLHAPLRPLMILYRPNVTHLALVKIDGRIAGTAIRNIDKTLHSFDNNAPFDFKFMDDEYSKQYESEKTMGQFSNLFTLLAIIISCLGLFGLALFTTEQATKEIGIRKSIGAKTWQIMLFISKGFLKWIVIAFAVASILAYIVLNDWLQNFAYKTEMSWWIFALAGFISLLIALLTVSWQSWRAANKNPVEALRYE